MRIGTRIALGIGLAIVSSAAAHRPLAANGTNGLDRLDAGVQAAEGVRAVKRLQYSYSHYLTAGLWVDVEDLFTDNAIAEFPGKRITGKAAIRAELMARAGRSSAGLAARQLNTHIALQPIVTLSGDGRMARGTWHEVAMLGTFGKNASWLGGVYENEYVRSDGVWKISRLRYFEQYRGSYEEWGHTAPPAWNIPYHFEALRVGVPVPSAALNAPPSTTGSADARLAALSGRLERLRDEADVQNLQHSYGYYLDRKLYDDVGDLFTANGMLQLSQGRTHVGAPQITQALAAAFGSSPLQTGELFDHIIMSTLVTVARDGHRAAARSTELSQIGRNGAWARWELGTYENEFVKQGGIWKIQTVHYAPTLSTDYDKGWAVDGLPSIQFPRMHHAHPVTGRVARPAVVRNVTLGEAEKWLDTAIAYDAVENLNSSYGYYIDESAWDSMADTFSVTAGAKEITGAGVYVGRDRIRTILNLRGPRGGRTPTFFTIHQLTQPVIHLSDDGTKARARLRLFQSGGNADGSSGSWIGGIYENTAVKENGEWKFGVQDLHHSFNASYRNGWARVGAAARDRAAGPGAQPATGRNVPGGGITQGLGGAASPNRFAAEFPPDRPIRSRQYTFPEVSEPAFHYRNPVSGRMPRELLP